ncbi:MAG: tRNA pseudouridine(55) synthase TruB [Bacilli bacterium]|nr:tRNA pseudouridine(55) synthase TruB [Bacilli bacterium]
MNGVLFIDKKENMTSRDVVNEVCKLLHTKKVGHTGTLDPLASGVLILYVGTYTKLVESLTSQDKTYVATMKLGVKTDTGDITGNVLERNSKSFSEQDITLAFQNFPIEYEQTVPIYSAVKVNGKKLYEYARNGEKIDLPKRVVHIYDLKILSINNDEIEFETRVSKGTYIRSLIEDIASSLGTIATMSSLRRIKQGNVSIKDCISISNLTNEPPLKQLTDLFDYPKYEISDEEYHKVQNGNALSLKSMEPRLFLAYEDHVVAIYEKKDDIYKMIFKAI